MLESRPPNGAVRAKRPPTLPQVAKPQAQSAERQHNQRLDGVISTDPVAMGYVLEATGPAALRGTHESTQGEPMSQTTAGRASSRITRLMEARISSIDGSRVSAIGATVA